MLPDPMHPAVVHFPIVLAVIAPFVAAGALWTIRRGARPDRAWGLAAVVIAALAVSSWVAVETGEQQEDRVEDVVAERPLDTHEDAAELFLWLSGGLVGIATLGLMRGRAGSIARLAATAGTVGLLGVGWYVGQTGGELVYRHGAASAYTGTEVPSRHEADSDDDDEEEASAELAARQLARD